MSAAPIDYDALAQKHGAAIDYDALAQKHGASASSSPSPTQDAPESKGFLSSAASQSGLTGAVEGLGHAISNPKETISNIGSSIAGAPRAALNEAHDEVDALRNSGLTQQTRRKLGEDVPMVGSTLKNAQAQHDEGNDAGMAGTLVGGIAGMAAPEIAGQGIGTGVRMLGSGKRLGEISESLKGVPVTLNEANAPLQRATEIGVRRASFPPQVNNFLQRSQSPIPMTFPEARDYQGGLTDLSRSDRMGINSAGSGALKQLNKGLFKDMKDTADTQGLGDDFQQAMKDYKRLQQLKTAGKVAAGAAIPSGIAAHYLSKLFLLLLFITPIAFGQAYRFDNVATTTGNPVAGSPSTSGPLAPVLAIANTQVQLCTVTFPACQVLLQTYTDETATTQCPTSAQLTRPGVSGCFATSDAQGNFGAWVALGTPFQYVITTYYGASTAMTVTPQSAGGAGNPAAPFFSQQFNNSGVFGGSAALLNLAGDSIVRSLGGTLQPQLLVSGGGNNGIANGLNTKGGAVVQVGAGYTNEDLVGTGTWRVPFGQGGFGPPPTFQSNSMFTDQRLNSYGDVFYNQIYTTPMKYDLNLQNDFYGGLDGSGNPITQQAGGGQNWLMYDSDWMAFCCGKNEQDNDVGNWTTREMFTQNMVSLEMGIDSVYNINIFKNGFGDSQMLNLNSTPAGGDIEPSAEGQTILRNQMLQSQLPAAKQPPAALPKGTTVILTAGTNILTGIEPGENQHFVDATQEQATLHVTAITNTTNIGGIPQPGTLTTYEAISGAADTFGVSPTNILTPQLYRGATTNEVINLTNLTAAITCNTAVGTSGCSGGGAYTACISDTTYTEQANVITVGAPSGSSPNITQTVTLALRLRHFVGAQVTQGPHACWGVEAVVNRSGGPNCANNPANPPCYIMALSWVIGVKDAHTIAFSRPETSGGWASFSNGLFSIVNLPSTGISRTGGVTSITTPMLQDSVNMDSIQVTGCSDASFNGTFANIVAGASTISWTNPGSNGTTTCSNPIWIINPSSGLPANGIAMLPMSTVVQAINPNTKTPDLSYVLEANPYTIAANDVLMTEPAQILANAEHTLWQILTPTTASNPASLYFTEVESPFSDGFSVMHVVFAGGAAGDLIGAGGTRQPGGLIFDFSTDPGIFDGWIAANAPAHGTLFNVVGCNAYDCSDPKYNGYNIFNLGGGYNTQWTPSSGTFKQSISIPSIGLERQTDLPNAHSIDVQDAVNLSDSSMSIAASNVFTLGTFNGSLSNALVTDTFTQNYAGTTNVVSNTSIGTTTFTQTAGAFSFVGGPTAVATASTVNSLLITGVSSSATVGQVACIKASGVVGFCTGAVSGTSSCTCN